MNNNYYAAFERKKYMEIALIVLYGSVDIKP